jgi:hypothetical protein
MLDRVKGVLAGAVISNISSISSKIIKNHKVENYVDTQLTMAIIQYVDKNVLITIT